MITIIFGAGASLGSGMTQPYNAPLGNQLFGKLVSLNGAFSRLPKEIKMSFEKDGFESGMKKISNNSVIINPLQKEIACYLSKFKSTPCNAYTRIFYKLRHLMDSINIATLNYDMLIEQSLKLNGQNYCYNSSGRGVSLIKPHGSSNFIPCFPEGVNIGPITAVNCAGSFVSTDITKALNSHGDIVEWCHDPKNISLSPVLCMYEEGKRAVMNHDTIKKIQEDYNNAIAASSLVVLVGIKYIEHDHHVWEPIENSNSSIIIVDIKPGDTENWANKIGKKYISIAAGFDESVHNIVKLIRRHTNDELFK